jgi:hypothetical protein
MKFTSQFERIPHQPSLFRTMLTSAVAAVLVLLPQGAVAQETMRLRGTIEKASADAYIIRTRSEKLVTLRLMPNGNIAASIRSTMSDIKPGVYLGIAAVPQGTGPLRALEAHIFDESMRGTAEGHRNWDLLPESTMTNAVVQEMVQGVDGRLVTLKYRDGEKQILIPETVPIVTYVPGSSSDLKPGATIFVPAATALADGSFESPRVMVGRTAPPPQ